jgi:hypothetical protein
MIKSENNTKIVEFGFGTVTLITAIHNVTHRKMIELRAHDSDHIDVKLMFNSNECIEQIIRELIQLKDERK